VKDMGDRSEYCLFCGQDILAPAGGMRPSFPGEPPADLAARAAGRRDYAGLGPAEGIRFAALELTEEDAAAAVASGSRRMGLRQALSEYDAAAMAGALRGAALLRWLEVARRCGACGGELADQAAAGGRAAGADAGDEGGRACAACGRVFFPRISPAVIVLVVRAGKILLAHNARFPAGRFGLIAGYVEAGETFEEAAARETREEAGIEIGELRYVKSQSWPFPDSLMIAFTARWVSGEARPDGREIEELRWCGPDELPDIPPPGSVARFLIDRFISEEGGASPAS
jgi:NAD+ diphosphatase